MPHHSGALLPPTIYNPPLPRYKPVQPLGLTMMIFRRRIARARRFTKEADLRETLKAVRMEADVFRRLGAANPPVAQEDLDEWGECGRCLRSDARADGDCHAAAPFHEHHARYAAAYEREQARSMMVFDEKTLLLAKRARIVKKRVHIARKYARHRAEVARMHAGSPNAASES